MVYRLFLLHVHEQKQLITSIAAIMYDTQGVIPESKMAVCASLRRGGSVNQRLLFESPLESRF
jgi:hypothetical protein